MSGLINHTIKMATSNTPILRKKFRGALLGSLLGDCLGAPFEGDVVSAGDKLVIQKYFNTLSSTFFQGPMRCYTDDTAMMKSVAQSLMAKPDIDFPDMARRFVKEYFSDPRRGYGQNVVEVFNKLRKNKFADIYKPAAEQFEGSGSFGNGGAMRIAPIALHFHQNYDGMIKAAEKSTRITHTNSMGVHGAILQCIAVHHALMQDPSEPLDPQLFCEELINKMKPIEQENYDGLDLADCTPYQLKLKEVQRLLKTKYHDELDEHVIADLGNSISAYESVPTAIYCFLRALREIPTVETDNVLRRSIQYAITLGGDTDTIACMTGAICGAFLGEDGIEPNMLKHCEFSDEMQSMADDLFSVVK